MTAVGADPGVYEAWLCEATELMLDQAGVGSGGRVLDVAAGAGGQTLVAARRTGPEGVLLATDISELLVERVRFSAITAGVSHVYAAVADAAELDFHPGAFDAAICRLGLMHLPDVATALRTIRVALRLGGRFSAIVYDEPEHNPVLAAITGTDEPFSLSAPGALQAARTPASSTSRSRASMRRSRCRTAAAPRSGCWSAEGGGHSARLVRTRTCATAVSACYVPERGVSERGQRAIRCRR